MLKKTRKIPPLLVALGLCFSLLACKKAAETSEDETLLNPVSDPSDGPTHSESPFSSALMRLSPEQISRTLKASLGFSLSWDGGDGRMVDGIVEQFGLPLGGIDFENSFRRDPLAKVQTLLVARLIAWRGAEYVVWKDFEALGKGAAAAELKIFAAPFNPWVDLPDAGDEKEKIWTTQLENIYWSLLSRPPNSDELALHRETFQEIKKDENAGVAWATSVYAILGGSEFWNLWGPRTAPQEGI